jgi:hypothetical protein
MRKINRLLQLKPVTLALLFAVIVGLLLSASGLLLPVQFAPAVALALGLSLAIDQLLVLLLLIILFVVASQWILKNVHEYIGHFHPRARHP